jgi:hypothetical protein
MVRPSLVVDEDRSPPPPWDEVAEEAGGGKSRRHERHHHADHCPGDHLIGQSERFGGSADPHEEDDQGKVQPATAARGSDPPATAQRNSCGRVRRRRTSR